MQSNSYKQDKAVDAGEGLPNGSYTIAGKELLYFKLFFPCPGEKCDKTCFYWNHKECARRLYIDEMGFIFCVKLLNKEKCTGRYFIQFAEFLCGGAKHTSEYKKVENTGMMLILIGNAIKSIDNVPGFNKKAKKQFANNLLSIIAFSILTLSSFPSSQIDFTIHRTSRSGA